MSILEENQAHILIVDDDLRIRSLLQEFLSQQGYHTSIAANSREATQKIDILIFDLIVLDIMMPHETGLEMTKKLRQRNNQVPILMLTAKTDVKERIEGLTMGANDYLCKPFETQELVLRIKNILRHKYTISKKLELPKKVAFGDYHFTLKQGEMTRNNQRILLTSRDIELLRYFSSKTYQIVKRSDLLNINNKPFSERSIDVQINRLRHKIEDNAHNPIHLQTVRGKGYIFKAVSM